MRNWLLPVSTLALAFFLSACALFSSPDLAEKLLTGASGLVY